ncbi:MAG: tyrosine protein kinase [Erysipelotrichia bacterium]|nr:tyrosine protein kinase [Erysipelotrichia bacterium]
MEEVVSLQEIALVLKKRMLLIFSMMILGVVALAGVTFFLITPKYGTDTQLVVQSNQETLTNANLQSDLTGNVMMVNTYKDLIKSDVVLDQVSLQLAKENGIQYTSNELNKMISVTQSQNSQMFSIRVISINAKEAMEIANKTAMIFKAKAVEILKVDKVSIISPAKLQTTPVSPNKKLNLLIGAVIGLILGVMIVFLLEFLDKTVKDTKFIENELELPILGEISVLSNKELQSSLFLNVLQKQGESFEFESNSEPRITKENEAAEKFNPIVEKQIELKTEDVERVANKRRLRPRL